MQALKKCPPNVKHIILLQTGRNMQFCYTTCQEKIYYFERHITIKSSINAFSVPFSIPFSSPVCLLEIPYNKNGIMPGCCHTMQRIHNQLEKDKRGKQISSKLKDSPDRANFRCPIMSQNTTLANGEIIHHRLSLHETHRQKDHFNCAPRLQVHNATTIPACHIE